MLLLLLLIMLYRTIIGVSDTYLLLDVWQKCHVYINGIHIGRYWWTGPQRTLYIPAPYLRTGTNEIIIWSESGIPSRPYVEFVDEPLWAN